MTTPEDLTQEVEFGIENNTDNAGRDGDGVTTITEADLENVSIDGATTNDAPTRDAPTTTGSTDTTDTNTTGTDNNDDNHGAADWNGIATTDNTSSEPKTDTTTDETRTNTDTEAVDTSALENTDGGLFESENTDTITISDAVIRGNRVAVTVTGETDDAENKVQNLAGISELFTESEHGYTVDVTDLPQVLAAIGNDFDVVFEIAPVEAVTLTVTRHWKHDEYDVDRVALAGAYPVKDFLKNHDDAFARFNGDTNEWEVNARVMSSVCGESDAFGGVVVENNTEYDLRASDDVQSFEVQSIITDTEETRRVTLSGVYEFKETVKDCRSARFRSVSEAWEIDLQDLPYVINTLARR